MSAQNQDQNATEKDDRDPERPSLTVVPRAEDGGRAHLMAAHGGREDWLARVAHDLGQPTSVVRIYAELIAQVGVDETVHRAAKHIVEAAAHLEQLIADIKDATAFRLRHVELHRAPMDAVALVAAFLECEVGAVQFKRASLRVDGRIPWVLADPSRVEQVLSNLLSNAEKYGAKDKEIRLTIRHDATEVVLSVINEGPVLPREQCTRVFERYYRYHAEPQALADGLGLGLYISRELVEAHGGRIWAESEPGGPTTFSFTLPVTAR
jgi:signal transduction histidine kinase